VSKPYVGALTLSSDATQGKCEGLTFTLQRGTNKLHQLFPNPLVRLVSPSTSPAHEWWESSRPVSSPTKVEDGDAFKSFDRCR